MIQRQSNSFKKCETRMRKKRSQYDGVKEMTENIVTLAKTNKLFMIDYATKRVRPMTLTEWREIHREETRLLTESETKSSYSAYLSFAEARRGKQIDSNLINECYAITSREFITECSQCQRRGVMDRLVRFIKELKKHTTSHTTVNITPKDKEKVTKKIHHPSLDKDYDSYVSNVMASRPDGEKESTDQVTSKMKLQNRIDADDFRNSKEREAEEEAEEALKGIDLSGI